VTAQAVASPVHAVPAAALAATRGSDADIKFTPTPAGAVNAITFDPPSGVTITAATGCGSTLGLPTSSTYTCALSTNYPFTAPIILTVHVDPTAASGLGTGQVTVTQTDNTTVIDSWFVNVQDIHASQSSTAATTPGATGTATFNPTNPGLVSFVVFNPPPGVTITGASGCPQQGTLPTSSTFVCRSLQQAYDSPITLTYNVDASAQVPATFTGSVNVGQLDGSQTTDSFAVTTAAATPPGPGPSPGPGSQAATKVSAVHVTEPSAYGQASSMKVTVARDGSTGTAPVGAVTLTDAAGTMVASGQLVDGMATLPLSPKLAVGTRTLTAKYAGTDAFATSQAQVTVTVKKAATTTKAKRPKKKPAFRADFKIKVKVNVTGLVAKGKLKVTYKGKTIGKGKLKKGKATIKIKKDLKVGKRKLVVKYLGSAKTLASKGKVTVTIVK
jgi:5'-nucleotidase